MSALITIPPRPATPESIIAWENPKPSIHEFWTRAGEVKNLALEFERLRQQAASRQAADDA